MKVHSDKFDRVQTFRPVKSSSKRRGFTLVETAIASAILVLAIMGTLTVASRGYKLTQSIREFSRANQILQQKMEDIRLLRFSSIQALPGTFRDPRDTQGKYAGTMEIQTYRTDSNGNPVSLKVTLKLSWTGRNKLTRTQTLVTVFTRTGLNDYIF